MSHSPIAKPLLIASLLSFGLSGCVDEGSGGSIVNPGGKDDSGWIGADTFEVNAVVTATVEEHSWGEWTGLDTDGQLQADLVDTQLKFIKTTAESYGWRFNQLAGDVAIIGVSLNEADNLVTIEYQATVDMLGRFRGELPALEDIDPIEFSASVPLDPNGFSYTEIQACSEADDGHSAAAYNFHYYFTPQKEGCEIPLFDAAVEITEVFNRPTVYPEYDQLMQDLGDGKIGFTAALVPNTGDEDRMSRFNAHADMLERELDL